MTERYYQNAAGVSLMVNRMISTCSLHSEDPAKNARYKLDKLEMLPSDAIQTNQDLIIAVNWLTECALHLPEEEITAVRLHLRIKQYGPPLMRMQIAAE